MSQEGITIHPFTDHGFERLVELNRSTYHGRDISNSDYLGWEYIKNPDGIAVITIAEENNRIVSQYAVIPREFSIDNKIVIGSLSVNTLTHPDYKGKNLFRELAEDTFRRCREKGINFTIGFPNPVSSPVIRRKKILDHIGVLPFLCKPLRPFTSALKYITGKKDKSGSEIELKFPDFPDELSHFEFSGDREIFNEFINKFNRERINITLRTLSFLKWRYVSIPGRKYHILKYVSSGKLQALAVVRSRYLFGLRCLVIVDLITIENSSGVQRLLKFIRTVSRMNKIDMIITSVSSNSHEHNILKDAGYYSMPKWILPQKIEVIVRKHIECEGVDNFNNWFLTFGDYDIF